MCSTERASQLLRISSHNRITELSPSSSNFTIGVNTANMKSVSKVSFLQASFPNVFYNIYAPRNVWNFQITGQPPSSITLEEAYYDTGDLITELQSKLGDNTEVKAASATFAFNPISPNFLNFSFTLGTATGFAVLDSPISEILGFTPAQYGIDQGINVSGAGAINLNTLPVIYIHSKALGSSHMVSGERNGEVSSAVMSVPITAEHKKHQTFVVPTEDFYSVNYPTSRALTHIDLKVRDKYGNLLSLLDTEIDVLCKVHYKLHK